MTKTISTNIISFEEKISCWKQAYAIYVSNKFTTKESQVLCKTLVLRCVELINEGIVTNQKQAFRLNRDIKLHLALLMSEEPKFTKIQQKLILQTLENFKLYCIVKVQGMKS